MSGILLIVVVFDVNEQLDKFMVPEITLKEIIFDYYVNFIPYFMSMFAALFTFIAVIFFTSKLADKSEIIAMLSTGMSFDRLIFPYIVSATIIAVSMFMLSAYVIPPANAERLDFVYKYIKKNKKVEHARNVQLEVEPGVFAYFDTYNNESKMGYRFSLEHFEGKTLVSRLTANSIKYDSLYQWTLRDYIIRDFDGMYEHISSGTHKDTTLMIVPQDFLISETDCETMTSPQLSKFIKRQKKRGIGNIQMFEIEYHKRIANAFSYFILTIIGVSLSSRKKKGGMGLNIGIGLGLSFSYILFMTVTSSFAVSGMVSPSIACWIPNIIYTLIAIYLYHKAPR
jgi:lipopolysaccharide export system permease protein